MALLEGKKIVTTAVNLPGPKACKRLCALGAEITKVEPPLGDPLKHFYRSWYEELSRGQKIIPLNLKEAEGRENFLQLLEGADLLLMATLPKTLEKLGISWASLHERFPKLSFLQILAFKEDENKPGHDINLQLANGLIDPPHLPKTLTVDFLTAERVVNSSLQLLLGAQGGQHLTVHLNEVAKELRAPLRHGATGSKGLLGGALPTYGLYQASDGWVSIAALEPGFVKTLESELDTKEISAQVLSAFFADKKTAEISSWAEKNDLPISILANS